MSNDRYVNIIIIKVNVSVEWHQLHFKFLKIVEHHGW